MARGRPWLEWEDNAIREMSAERQNVGRIGEYLKRTPMAVTVRKSKLRIISPKAHDRADMQVMWIQRDLLRACQRHAAKAGIHRVEYVRRVLANHLESL